MYITNLVSPVYVEICHVFGQVNSKYCIGKTNTFLAKPFRRIIQILSREIQKPKPTNQLGEVLTNIENIFTPWSMVRGLGRFEDSNNAKNWSLPL